MYNRSRSVQGLAIFSGVLLSAVGCATHKGQAVDGLSGRLSLTTASAEAVRAANITRPSTPERRDPQFHVSPKSGAVTHTPVYFRSNTELPDDNDKAFGLSGEDFAVFLPEVAKFFISIALHPLDVLLTPPWTLMESDGHQTRRAAPGDRNKHGSG